jgi:hypothetical protein
VQRDRSAVRETIDPFAYGAVSSGSAAGHDANGSNGVRVVTAFDALQQRLLAQLSH